MSVLLLRLAGPMQSWGTQSRFGNKDTGLEPSKSGVIGLLCAALGRPREADVSDLVALKMAVRVDREGRMSRDYHTAQKVRPTDEKSSADTVLSERFYLADADFLVGLEGDRKLLERLNEALLAPVWPIFLGRKSFVPGTPVHLKDGVRDGEILRVLGAAPWLRRRPWETPEPGLRAVVETPFGEGPEVRQDVPISFSPRRFTIRHVRTEFLPAPAVEDDPCYT